VSDESDRLVIVQVVGVFNELLQVDEPLLVLIYRGNRIKFKEL
jgi:hypothetical protein